MQLQTTTGATARDYLDQRGLRAETIRHFRLGFAPDDRQALMKALGGHGVEMKDMIAAGLVVKNDRGEHYSRFRGRIMFPITTPRAQVIAFGGRIMDAQANPNAPKYLNSPETELFHKGEQLYHYGEARQAAQKEALVVCEGYMDVIALHQAGHHAAVAPLGTAMTESQLRLCWAACDTPVLALDGDAAGVRAMQRAADVALPMLQPGKSLKILTLPAGEDPDTLVRSGGLGAWNRALAASQDLAQLLWQRIAELPDGSPEQRAAMDQSAEALCERIAHSGVQQHYRDFFRDRLREMRRPVFQPGGSGRTPQRSGSKTGPMRLPPLPDPQNNHAMQERISMHLLGLFCIAPSLLAHADSEHVLMHSPLPAPWQKVADHLLHWSAAQPDLKAAGLADALQLSLQNTLGADLWQRFAGAWLPRHSPDNTQHADMLYRQLMQRWQHRAMLMEYQAFQREHAGKMDEETYRRLQALQQQLRLSEQSAAAMPDAWMTE
jgi:DNA primase